MLDIPTIERWIKLIATAFGILAICLPVFQVWQNRHTKIKHNLSKRASQNSWVLVFISTIAYISIGILLWKPIPIDISPSLLLFLDIAGMVLYFQGIFLYLWGLKTLGSTFGVSSSKGAQLYEQHHVIDSGPYAFLRHPMYFGVVLAAIGALLLFRTWAMVLFTPSSRRCQYGRRAPPRGVTAPRTVGAAWYPDARFQEIRWRRPAETTPATAAAARSTSGATVPARRARAARG